MACPHLALLDRLSPPKLSQSVHREECTQCFDNQDGPDGIDVCLSCFNGGCVSGENRCHAQLHATRADHTFSLNVRRTLKQRVRDDAEPPAKLTKLAIMEEREEDKYEWHTTLRCWMCNPKGRLLPEANELPKVKALTAGVMQSMSSGRQSEVKAWEEEIVACEHTLTLQQDADRGHIDQAGLAHCSQCDLRENLWLCLTCGALGCGRAQYGGIGGNGHALAHFNAANHPVAVKLGTITPEGAADIYCYACNDSRVDPELQLHLSTFGINVQTQKKTEKSTTEMQIEYNLSYDFSMTGDDGKAMEPLFGPGLTGLKNLGNSCYMASTLQALFALPQFRKRYYGPSSQQSSSRAHFETCPELLPASCIECQMLKIADGLLSGRYAVPRAPSADAPHTYSPEIGGEPAPVTFQDGIKPTMLKALIGQGHIEFATMRQQDAEEFLAHLLKSLRTYARKVGRDEAAEPGTALAFAMQQRLQCNNCKRVRYSVDEMDIVSVPVPAEKDGDKWREVALTSCIGMLVEPEELQYNCPACQAHVTANKSAAFATFPDVLVVHAKKFQLVNWVPTKLDIPVILPQDDTLVLDSFFGRGLQPGEEPLPEDSTVASAPAAPTVDAGAKAQLEGMGFSSLRAEKALRATGGVDAEAAMEWLFAHLEDPDIDAPLSESTSAPQVDESSVAMLADMGFTSAQARKALRETGGNAERAVEWLFNHPDDTGDDNGASTATAPAEKRHPGSTTLPAKFRLRAFISHKGPSVHSGHYVAHVRHDDGWVLFNDEKVVRASAESVEELKKLAYLYIFERI